MHNAKKNRRHFDNNNSAKRFFNPWARTLCGTGYTCRYCFCKIIGTDNRVLSRQFGAMLRVGCLGKDGKYFGSGTGNLVGKQAFATVLHNFIHPETCEYKTTDRCFAWYKNQAFFLHFRIDPVKLCKQRTNAEQTGDSSLIADLERPIRSIAPYRIMCPDQVMTFDFEDIFVVGAGASNFDNDAISYDQAIVGTGHLKSRRPRDRTLKYDVDIGKKTSGGHIEIPRVFDRDLIQLPC